MEHSARAMPLDSSELWKKKFNSRFRLGGSFIRALTSFVGEASAQARLASQPSFGTW